MMDEESADQNLQNELDDIRQIDQILHEDSDAEDYVGSDLEIGQGLDEQRGYEDEDVDEQFYQSGFAEVPQPVLEDEPNVEVYSETDGDVDSDVSLEELLLLNRQYQELIVMNLNRVREALEKNREMQTTRLDLKKKDCVVVLKKFMPPYFKDKFDHSHRDNEDTVSIKQAGYPVPTDIQYPRQWSKQDVENLKCGVKADGLEREMTPLLNQREVQEKRLRDAVVKKDKQAAREAKKEIAEIDKSLNSLKSCPLEKLLGSVHREVDWQKVAMRHLDGSRTAEECRAHWQVAAHPSIKSVWTAAEEKRLKEIAKNSNCRDWNAIAAKLGTGHSAFECIKKYQQKLNTSLYKRPFTPEEDKKIMKLIEKYRVGDHIPWSKVCYFLKDRKTNQISWRWETKLDPSLRFGRWQKWEDDRLTELVQKQKNEVVWVKVAMGLEGRSASQCRTRWLNSLNPELRKGRFSAAEDLILLEAVKKCGTGRWSNIADAMKEHPNLAPGRNAAMFMWRYRYLVKYFVDDERRSFNERRRKERRKTLEKEMAKVSGNRTDVVALPQEETYKSYLAGLDPSTFLDRLISATKQKVDELGENAHKANVSEVRGHTYWLPCSDPPTTKDGVADKPGKDQFIRELKEGLPLARHKTVASYLKEGTPGTATVYPKDMHLETQIMKALFPQKTLQPDLILQRAHKSFLKFKRCSIIATEFNKKKAISWSTAISVLMSATKVNFRICRGIIHHNCKIKDIKFPMNAKRHLEVTTAIEKKPPKKLRKLSVKTSHCVPTKEGPLDRPNHPGVGAVVSGDTTGQTNVGPKTKMVTVSVESQNGNQPTNSKSDSLSEAACVLKISDSLFLVVNNSKSQTQNSPKPNLFPNMENPKTDRTEGQTQLNREDVAPSNIKTNTIPSQGNCGNVANAVTSTNNHDGSGVMLPGKFKPYSRRRKATGGGNISGSVTTEVARLSATAPPPAEELWVSQVVEPETKTTSIPVSPDRECTACLNNTAASSLFPSQVDCQCGETVIVAEIGSDEISSSVSDKQQEGQGNDSANSDTPSRNLLSAIVEDGRSPSDTQTKIREDGKNDESEILNKETLNPLPSEVAPLTEVESEMQADLIGEGVSSVSSQCASGGTDDIHSPSKDQHSKQPVAQNCTVREIRDQTLVSIPQNSESEHSNTLDDIHHVTANRDTDERVGKDVSIDSQKKNQSEEVANDVISGKTDKTSDEGAPVCVGEQSQPYPGDLQNIGSEHSNTLDDIHCITADRDTIGRVGKDVSIDSQKNSQSEEVANDVISGKTDSASDKGAPVCIGEQSHPYPGGTRGSSDNEKKQDEGFHVVNSGTVPRSISTNKGSCCDGGQERESRNLAKNSIDKDKVEVFSRKGTKGGRKKGGKAVMPCPTLTRPRRKTAPKPGDFVIPSSDDDDGDYSSDDGKCTSTKSQAKEDISITTCKAPESTSKSTLMQPPLLGLSPDTKVLIGPDGAILGILPEVFSNNTMVFPTRNQFASVVQPHASLGSVLPFQVPQLPVDFTSQVATVPTLITPNTVLHGSYSLPSLPSNQAMPLNSPSIQLVSPPNAIAQTPAPGPNAIVHSPFPSINQSVLGSIPTAVTPNLGASNQIVQQPLDSIAITNSGDLSQMSSSNNAMVTSNLGSANLLAPQTVVIPGNNPLSQVQVSPSTSHLQNVNTAPNPTLTVTTLIPPAQHTNIVMPNLIHHPALPLGQTGGVVLLPTASPTTVVIPSETISQPQSNLNLPTIAPLPSVAATSRVSESSKSTETVHYRNDDGTVNGKIGVSEPEARKIENGSSKTAKAATVRGMIERKKMIMSKKEDHLACKPSNHRQPFLPELLEDDLHTVNLDKLENFTSAILGNTGNGRTMALLPPNLSTLFSFKHLLIKKASLEESAERFSVNAAQLQSLVDDVNRNSAAYKKYHSATDMQGNISKKEFLHRIHRLPIYRLFQERFVAYFLWPAFLSLLNAYPPKRKYKYKGIKADGRQRSGSLRKRKRNGLQQSTVGGEMSNLHENGEIQGRKKLKKKTTQQGQRSPKRRNTQVKVSVQPLRRGTRKTPLRKSLPLTDQVTTVETF